MNFYRTPHTKLHYVHGTKNSTGYFRSAFISRVHLINTNIHGDVDLYDRHTMTQSMCQNSIFQRFQYGAALGFCALNCHRKQQSICILNCVLNCREQKRQEKKSIFVMFLLTILCVLQEDYFKKNTPIFEEIVFMVKLF